EKLDTIQQMLAKATSDYSSTLEKSSEFARIAEAVGLTLNELNARNEALREQSQALADLLLSASGSLPEIEQKIVEIARQVSDGLSNNQKVLDEALTSHIRTIEGGVQKASEGIVKHTDEAARSILQLTSNTNEHLTAAAKSIQDRVADSHKAVADSLTENASRLSSVIGDIVTAAVTAASEQSK